MILIRKQLYIYRGQQERLRRRARELEASEADLLRRSIQLGLEALPSEAERDEAWARIEALWSERDRLRVTPSVRTWTRDDLYDERPKYLSGRH